MAVTLVSVIALQGHVASAVLAASAIAVVACQQPPNPPWVLSGPAVLAIRTTVVVEGEHSRDLLPIPADRVRGDPLPGDTLLVEVLIADETGALDSEPFDVRLFLCPKTGRCFSHLRQPDGGRACDQSFPSESICELGSGDALRYVVPPLDPQLSLLDQTQRRLAVVAGVPGVTDTDTCIRRLGATPFEDLQGCLLAVGSHSLGPEPRLLGISMPAMQTDAPGELPMPYQPVLPEIRPEVARLEFRAIDMDEPLSALPDHTTSLPPHAILPLVGYGDPRDAIPPFPSVDFSEARTTFDLFPFMPRMYATLPDVVGPGPFALSTGEVGQEFRLIVTIVGLSGSQSWASFDFVVEEP